jgi:hypothetical protein
LSQAGILNVSGGGGGGTPIQTVTGDDLIAVPPTANNIFLVGGTSSSNNNNGITTSGNAGTSTETFSLTNRIQGIVTTTDATLTTLTSFSLGATPGVYNFDIQIVGFDITDTAGVGYFISGSVRTTGAAAALVGTPDKITNEEAATIGCDANLVVSGNTAIVQVTGIAGKTINWRSLSQYIFVS